MDICFCSLTGSVNTHGYKGEIKLQKTAYHFHCARSTSPAVNSSISTKTEEIQFKEKKKKPVVNISDFFLTLLFYSP